MARADAPGLGWEISTFGVLRCLTEFSAGTALCALWLRWAERPLAPAIGSAVVAAALLGGGAAGVLPEVVAVPVGMAADRKSVVEGTSASVRVALGGRRSIKKINNNITEDMQMTMNT